MVADKVPHSNVLIACAASRVNDALRTLLNGHGGVISAVIHQKRHGQRTQVMIGIKIGIGKIKRSVVERHEFGHVFDHRSGRAGFMHIGADGHGHLLAPLEHRRRSQDGKSDILPLGCQNRGYPCAFGFGVDAGFCRIDACSATQHIQRTAVFAGESLVVAMQHGVIVIALGRNQRHNTGGCHSVGNVAEVLGPAGAGSMDEQAGRATARRINRLPQDGRQRDSIVHFNRQLRFTSAISALMRNVRMSRSNSGIRRGNGNMIVIRTSAPLRHHRPAKQGEH